MAHPQLRPLELHPLTHEPFLRLPPPHSNIIITPPRPSDKSVSIPTLNDPRVYKCLSGTPYPYLEEHADEWHAKTKAESDAILRELAEAGDSPLKTVGGCPIRILREIKEDGSDALLGDIGFLRCRWPEILDKKEKERLLSENDAKEVGDPSIVWEFGDYLVPSHHGKGIMSTAIGAIIQARAIPRMGVRHIACTAFVGNIGSKRVFEKNGFEFKGIAEDCVVARGETRSLYLLEWRF